MVMAEGLKVVLRGAAAGIAGALSLNRFIAGFLYGIAPTDALTYGVVTALLIAVSLAASYYPARAATRVDPLTALRHE
jgi:ABC-type antimicrobial peptide transport system permease subunit